jgi:hypothetical protein
MKPIRANIVGPPSRRGDQRRGLAHDILVTIKIWLLGPLHVPRYNPPGSLGVVRWWMQYDPVTALVGDVMGF